MSSHIEIYRERKMIPVSDAGWGESSPTGDWRWRFVFGNGKVGADGGEGYKRKTTMLRSMGNVLGGRYEEQYAVLVRYNDVGGSEALEIRRVDG